MLQMMRPFVLCMICAVACAGPVGKKNAVIEQEVLGLKENVTALWETLGEMRNRLDRLENEERIHHHHHHYHHYFKNVSDPTEEEMNHTQSEGFLPMPDHEHEFEHRHSSGQDGKNHDPKTGDHHHYHHHIIHNHAQGRHHEHRHHEHDADLTNGQNGHNKPTEHVYHPDNTETAMDDDGEEVLAQANCAVRPNRALPASERQNIRGSVYMKQKGQSLEITLSVRGFLTTAAHAPQHGHNGNDGNTGEDNMHVHGLHVHEFGDLSNGCQSAGNHYNPTEYWHGGPDSPERHVGDFGNIECDDQGRLETKMIDSVASLVGNYSIIGKTLVISENADDFGIHPNDKESVTNGNSGRRLACCVITKKED